VGGAVAPQLAMVEEREARAGRHALLIAPTGGGDLAGFLPSLIELSERAPQRRRAGVTRSTSRRSRRWRSTSSATYGAYLRDGVAGQAESRTGDTGVSRSASG
jgi:ATP-dependent Lhr-like helicase